MRVGLAAAGVCLVGMTACSRGATPGAPEPAARPSILLVTLDTTRADAIGPDAEGADTPSFDALASRGLRFTHAYATAPETLPSHASMLTGLYPAGHGVHENARRVPDDHALAAARLKQHGYRTAAVVSSFVLARRFGLARGFDRYDDELPAGAAERRAGETTERALAIISESGGAPLFLWVHYFDPHAPYEPPEPFRSRYQTNPYNGEVAFVDRELGRLVEAFERAATGTSAIVVAGDHGEGLGDHGEMLHGNLLYGSTMRVPLLVLGPSIPPGVSDTPVSVRRIYHTLLDLAGVEGEGSLRASQPEVVLGEAMKPFLEYGWQPQVMAVEGRYKAILAGRVEAYDLDADPGETRDLGSGADLPGSLRRALEDYPVPVPGTARGGAEALTDDARRQLASLGYVSGTATPVVRQDAPRPVDMVPLFGTIDRASGLFVQERYADAIPLLRKILSADSHNLDAALRLATAYSALGRDEEAIEAFRRASAIAPGSADVRTYFALHLARGRDWARAVPLLEQVVAESPERLPAVEGLAALRERQGRTADAIALRQQVHAMKPPAAAELLHLGGLAMSAGRTPLAIDSFETARRLQGAAFEHDLELGVLYLDARRLEDSRAALDRVPRSHPAYPMALFKRAQVSVLLDEPDQAERIARARRAADTTTRDLIARERLFQGTSR